VRASKPKPRMARRRKCPQPVAMAAGPRSAVRVAAVQKGGHRAWDARSRAAQCRALAPWMAVFLKSRDRSAAAFACPGRGSAQSPRLGAGIAFESCDRHATAGLAHARTSRREGKAAGPSGLVRLKNRRDGCARDCRLFPLLRGTGHPKHGRLPPPSEGRRIQAIPRHRSDSGAGRDAGRQPGAGPQVHASP